MLQQTLPITVPLSPRETAPSFMSRIAQANGVDAHTLGLELDLPFKKVIDGQHAEIRKLARLGGVDPAELVGWTPAKTENGTYAFRGAFFHGRTLRNPTVKGCPCCLKEDLAKEETMFLRGEWALPHVQSCPIHGHPLVPLWRDSNIHHRLESAPRLDAIEDAVVAGELERDTRDVTPFEHWLDQKLAGHPGGNWLDAHSFHAAATFSFLLGYALSRHFTSAPSRIKKSDHWHLYQMGFVVASCGEPAVRSALTSLEDLSSSPSDGPLKVFPRLYAALADDHADDPDFAPFRSLLREHILKTWPLGPGDELMGEPVLTRELHSLQTASRTTGVEAPRLRRVLEAAGVIGEASQSRADEWTVFSAAQASPLLRGRTELLAPERFCKSMSMEPELFQALAKSGILKPAHEDKTTGAIWDPQSGAILLDRLLYGATPLRQAQHSWLRLTASAKALGISSCDIVRAILDGRLRRIGNHADFDGFTAVYVDHDEVTYLFSETAGQTGPKVVSLDRFAKSLGLSNATGLQRLARAGLVATIVKTNPKTRKPQVYIHEADARAFHATYFTLRTLSLHCGIGMRSLSSLLEARGIQPLSPGELDVGPIYLRADIPKDLR